MLPSWTWSHAIICNGTHLLFNHSLRSLKLPGYWKKWSISGTVQVKRRRQLIFFQLMPSWSIKSNIWMRFGHLFAISSETFYIAPPEYCLWKGRWNEAHDQHLACCKWNLHTCCSKCISCSSWTGECCAVFWFKAWGLSVHSRYAYCKGMYRLHTKGEVSQSIIQPSAAGMRWIIDWGQTQGV